MISSLKEKIEFELESLLSKGAGNLYEAGRYSLLAPAKRIRPLFALLVSKLFDPNYLERGLHPACALELIHTYSLIHDDLPCMDDDDYRRGKPTLHRVYDEGYAVLVGDFLLTFAFEILADASSLSAKQKISLIKVLSHAAGGEGMVGGQALDLRGDAEIPVLHKLKTAALFEAAFQFGGIITNQPLEILETLKTIGMHVGLLFQYVDDLIDGDSEDETPIIEHYNIVMTHLQSLPHETHDLHLLISSIIEPLYDTRISQK